MVTQFVLRTDKKDSVGRCPVHLVVNFDGVRLKCATGEKCKPADWNATRQEFRKSYPLPDDANALLARLTNDALAWWRKLRAEGEAPTVAGLRVALRPAPVPEAVVVEQESVTVWYDDYRKSMLARGYAKETLRHHLVTRNWMVGFEKWAGVLLDPTTCNLELHDRLMAYLREERKLGPNSVATALKDLKAFLRWLRDERGVMLGLEIRKITIKKLFELNLLDGANKRKSRSEAVQFGFISAGLAAPGTTLSGATAGEMAVGGGGQRHFLRAQKRVRVAGCAG